MDITTAIIIHPNSGNSYCAMHNQVTVADADCYYCADQRRCPLCDGFTPLSPGPSVSMYQEIKEHFNTSHPLNSLVEWFNRMIDENIRYLYMYYDQ